jgi:hypothetical protein
MVKTNIRTHRAAHMPIISALGRASVPVAGGPISLHLLAGPAVGFRTSCEGEVDFEVQRVTIVDEAGLVFRIG